MHTLSIQQLQELRLAIFDNAEALHGEASLLLQNGMYSRAYLLAHFCFEELGKIPIVFQVAALLERGEQVEWKKVKKSFLNHEDKIASQNGHFYAFGRGSDFDNDDNLQWLINANRAVSESYMKKNLSTYVDARQGRMLRPASEIQKEDAEKLVSLASKCLRAHLRSESLTNPIIYEAEEREQSKRDNLK